MGAHAIGKNNVDYSSGGKDPILFEVKSGGVVICLSKDSTKRNVVYFDGSVSAQAALTKVKENISNYPLCEKIVGEQAWVLGLSELLQKNGFKEPKVVSIDTPSMVWWRPDTQLILVESAAVGSRKAAKKIKVLVVDDSLTIRNLLKKVFSQDPQIEIVGDLGNPTEVVAAIDRLKPDVITLDIYMPEMDGVTLLKSYIAKYKIPTVMISSLSVEDGPMVLDALSSGAVDYIQKPRFEDMDEVGKQIIEKVKAAANANIKLVSATAMSKIPLKAAKRDYGNVIVAIGSSTGGTEALKDVLEGLPDSIPPIVVVQHIPPVFSKALADRLDSLCAFTVKEAEDGDTLAPNLVLIAPGGRHMEIRRVGAELKVVLNDAEPVNRHRPSVDVLFDSVAKVVGAKSVGVILTGMGDDGAKGLLKMRQAGAKTIGQDKDTCVVYGMPRVAKELGAVETELPLLRIADHVLRATEKANTKSK